MNTYIIKFLCLRNNTNKYQHNFLLQTFLSIGRLKIKEIKKIIFNVYLLASTYRNSTSLSASLWVKSNEILKGLYRRNKKFYQSFKSVFKHHKN